MTRIARRSIPVLSHNPRCRLLPKGDAADRGIIQAMDKTEARELQADKIAVLRQMPYQGLHAWAESGKVATESVRGPSGREYQLEIQAWWDNRKGGDVRVMVSVDDGGWRAFKPLTDDFIMAPDGSFVDE